MDNLSTQSPSANIPTSSFLSKHTSMKKISIAIGSFGLLAVVFFLGSASHPAPVQKAEAVIPAEAQALGSAIAKDMTTYKSGEDMVNTGNSLMQKAALSARGKDMQLCADYQMSYSRTSKQLVNDPNCATASTDF